jgi:hypothetical protein
VDGDLPLAHHFERVAGHDDGGAFRKADAQQVGLLLHDLDQVVPAVARVDVLIDRGLAQESERRLVIRLRRHHDIRP